MKYNLIGANNLFIYFYVMANQPSISILMPVKNAELYLTECLDSIKKQSYSDWELIAVNDHSSDGSKAILERESNRDDRIRVIQNEGQGIIHALRLAYSMSRGNMITRMDADDLMTVHKLEVMSRDLEKYGPGHIAIGQVEYFSVNHLGEGYQRYAEWLNGLSSKGENFTEIYKECVVPSPCWMTFRDDLDDCGAFGSDLYPEDYDLCFRFFMGGLKCIPSNEILHLWRDHSERASRNDAHYLDNRFIELKVHYFARMMKDTERPIVLWGAGKKGKLIATHFIERGIEFHWITNNKKKIGLSIYDHLIIGPDNFDSLENPLLIIAIAAPNDQKELRSHPSIRPLEVGSDLFLFC